MKEDTRPAPREEYRGAVLQSAPGGAFVTIQWITCPLVIDGMSTSTAHAKALIDWFHDTGADQSRLPAPYRRMAKKYEVGRQMPDYPAKPEPRPAPPPAPPAQQTPRPAVPANDAAAAPRRSRFA